MLRNWERCTRSRRDEAVAQLFELILKDAKIKVADNNAKGKEQMYVSEY